MEDIHDQLMAYRRQKQLDSSTKLPFHKDTPLVEDDKITNTDNDSTSIVRTVVTYVLSLLQILFIPLHKPTLPYRCFRWAVYIAFGGICIGVGLTAVYVLLTVLLLLWYSLRGPDDKKIGEPSAYSVFNPNCERILGTFSAEDYDRQLRRGGMGL